MRFSSFLITLLVPLYVTAETAMPIRPSGNDVGESRRLLETVTLQGADIALVAPAAEDMRLLVEARAAMVRENKPVPSLGLAIDAGAGTSEDWIATAMIRFFRQVPRAHWAVIDGEPLVRLTELHAFKHVHPLLFENLRRRFRQTFGVNPRIVADDTEALRALAEDAEVRRIAAEMAKAGYWDTMTSLLASHDFQIAAGEGPTMLVARVFDKWLGRVATAQERVVAIERLKNVGASKFAHDVVTSEESRRTLVARWFRRYLDRKESLAVLKLSPDIASSVDALRAGQPPLHVLARILATGVKGGNDAFIDGLYAQLLRRCTDQEGRAFWLKRLSATSRENVAYELLTHEGPSRMFVAESVRHLLERNDPGLADETAALGEGSCGASAASRHDVGEYRREWERLLSMTPRPRLVIVDKTGFDGVRQLTDRYHSAK